MVKGRQGLYLEAWKFSVYVTVPIFASIYYSYPENQRFWADYWQYIEYPENPNTHVKEKIKELAEQKELQREQRKAYTDQLRQLQMAASRTESFDEETPNTSSSKPSWWRRAGQWVGLGGEPRNDS